MSAKKARARALKKYGITPEEWDKIFAFQNGRCAICDKPASHFKRRFSVDHDHSAHFTRGLICFACNRLIPARRDVIAILKRIITYLNFPPAVQVLGRKAICTPVKRRRKK